MYKLRYGTLQRLTNLAFLHLCDRITVQFKDYIGGYPASLRRRISVIGNPVGAAQLRAKPAEPGANGRYTLLAAGRFDPLQKRFDHVVSAFATLAAQHPQWDLRLIGDGPQENQLRAMVSELGLQQRVSLEPTTPDVFEAYAAAHLFVIPSLWEGFPNGLAEAMSHGLPAVGYRGAQGIAQLIEDGITGWLADGLDDPQALARALSAAMGDAEERERRGEQARFAVAVYTPEAQYDCWARLILSCTGSGTRR
jgi:glycosyltransferase involved in cell wall biosynthesis